MTGDTLYTDIINVGDDISDILNDSNINKISKYKLTHSQ